MSVTARIPGYRGKTARRRIALVLSMVFRERGGIPRFNQMLCRGLEQMGSGLGLQAKVISMLDRPADIPPEVRTWRHVACAPGHGKARTALAAARAAVGSEALLFGHVGLASLGAALSFVLPKKYGVIAHGREVWGEPSWDRRAALRRAARIFAVSRFTAKRVQEGAGVPPDRIRILPNTLAPEFEHLARKIRASAVPNGGPEMLTVSRLGCQERKGVDTTLLALARVAPDAPDLRYRIVGSGPDKPRLENLVRELGLARRVVFEEGVGDDVLARRYAECSFFVLPSGQEGFGIVYLEAMYFAKACIAARAGGAPEVVIDGETGLLVPYGDVDRLAAAIRRLASERDLRARYGQAGRDRVEKLFLFEHFVARLEGHLREWLGMERQA